MGNSLTRLKDIHQSDETPISLIQNYLFNAKYFLKEIPISRNPLQVASYQVKLGLTVILPKLFEIWKILGLSKEACN